MSDGDHSGELDTGLHCLVILAHLHHLPANPKQVVHEFGSDDSPLGPRDLLRAAKWLGLKAKSLQQTWQQFTGCPFPCIAQYRDGTYVLIGGVTDNEVLVKDLQADEPQKLTREDFETVWNGHVILVTRRANFIDSIKQFDFSWFIPFILKYKKYLGDVLIASFFLQLFALITPLFFQVVVDKVLVHRGLTTLDVLAVGLLVVSVFEVLLGGLRTYVFAHTTNRIDVALGSDLFNHLLRLPIAYFNTRRVGDTVARVRELETIRNFITGSSITLVID